jgi:hypothetical protein
MNSATPKHFVLKFNDKLNEVHHNGLDRLSRYFYPSTAIIALLWLIGLSAT